MVQEAVNSLTEDETLRDVLGVAARILLASLVLGVGCCLIGTCSRLANRRVKEMHAQTLEKRLARDEGEEEPITNLTVAEKARVALRPHLLHVDPTVLRHVVSVIQIAVRFALFIVVLSILRIDTAPFLAIFMMVWLVFPLSLQDTVKQVAGGMFLLIWKPVAPGDLVSIGGSLGRIEELQLCYTIIRTLENETVFLPNSVVATGKITNYSRLPTLRVDVDIRIAYSAGLLRAKELLMKCAKNEPRILEHPAPTILVKDLDAIGVVLTLRCWTREGDQIPVPFAIREAAKLSFDEEGVAFPNVFGAALPKIPDMQL